MLDQIFGNLGDRSEVWKHVEAGDFASSSTLLFTEWDFRIWISDNSINETLGY